MTFESFVLIQLCIIAIVFIFESVRGKRKNRSQKSPVRNFDGRIIVNFKDPEQESFRLEYDGSLAELPTREYIVFEIVRED